MDISIQGGGESRLVSFDIPINLIPSSRNGRENVLKFWGLWYGMEICIHFFIFSTLLASLSEGATGLVSQTELSQHGTAAPYYGDK